MKKTSILVLSVLVLLASVIFVAAAPELVANGDFSAGLSSWDNYGGATVVDDGNGNCGIADVLSVTTTAAGQSAGVEQCIPISSATGNVEWTLSADMRLISGTAVSIEAQFYNNPNCSGSGIAHTIGINTLAATPDLQPYSTTELYSAPANSSVMVLTQLPVLPAENGDACYDNISLSFVDPTSITLGSFGVQNTVPASQTIILLAVVAAILSVSAVIIGRRILG